MKPKPFDFRARTSQQATPGVIAAALETEARRLHGAEGADVIVPPLMTAAGVVRGLSYQCQRLARDEMQARLCATQALAAGEKAVARIAALQAEVAVLKAERDALRAHASKFRASRVRHMRDAAGELVESRVEFLEQPNFNE